MPNKPLLLYAEDDLNLGIVTKDHLELNGYDVIYVQNGDAALKMFKKTNFNLVILDVMMPMVDGYQVALEIRKINTNVPIIILTAKSLKEDKIEAFSLGADDYIVKPYSMEELMFKIKIFLKRSQVANLEAEESKEYNLGQFLFIPGEQKIKLRDQVLSLTHKESEVLRILVQRLGHVVKREDILNGVWGNDDYFNGRSLDVFISRLRKILQADSTIEILNVFAIGFKLILHSSPFKNQ